MKLFSSSLHLFSPSFVLHPAAEPRRGKSQLVGFCWGPGGTNCDQRDLGSSTRDEQKNYF